MLSTKISPTLRLIVQCIALASFCFLVAASAVEADMLQTKTLISLPKISNVEIGLNRTWKVGCSSRIAFQIDSQLDQVIDNLVSMETVDGEGIPVIYEFKVTIENCRSIHDEDQQRCLFETTVDHGRSNRLIRISLSTPDGKLIADHTLAGDERGNPIPVSQSWVVGIGRSMGLDEVAERSTQGRLPSYSSTELSDVAMLPSRSEAYRGVDLLVISTSPSDIIDRIALEQAQAICDWVRGGGKLQVWLGENTPRLENWKWLAEILPAVQQGVAPNSDPGTIESYLSSQKRLGKLTYGRFSLRGGIVDLVDRTKFPLIVRGAYGLGQVQIFAADLNRPPLDSWKDRKLLLERLLVDSIATPREIRGDTASQVTYLGYDDLSGQLRSALDLFPSVHSGDLLSMAAVLGLLVALIGPFDYFVLSRGLRQPTWTWWSLLLWTSVSLVIVIATVQWWKPRQSLLNSIELVDIDYSTRSIRGSAFFSQYVGASGQYDLSASARRIINSSNSNEATTAGTKPRSNDSKETPIHLSWSGQPGNGLGGFESTVRTDFGYPAYQVGEFELQHVGIPTAGTKSICGDWQLEDLKNLPETKFQISRGSDFLEGAWTNPMQEDLTDAVLIYRGWLYRLPNKIRPGGQVRIAAGDIPKDLSRSLQRRQSLKESEFGIPWDPTSNAEISRIVEMLTMHRAAGGTGYTGLRHHYRGELDLTTLAKLNRAIIFGKLATPVIQWTAKKTGEKMVVRDVQRSAFVRFVIPVTAKE